MANLSLRRQHPIPVRDDDVLLVDGCVVVEIEFRAPHFRRLKTYLRFFGTRLGLRVNFGDWRMRHGIKRVLNGLYEATEPIPCDAA